MTQAKEKRRNSRRFIYKGLNVVNLKQEIERLHEKSWRMQKYKKN